jgi:mono/diheme cytochrome c family protein
MRPFRYLIVLGLATVLAGLGLLAFSWLESARLKRAATAVARQGPTTASGPALLLTYCKSCHASGRSKVDFDEPFDVAALQRDRPVWTAALHLLRSREMPPAGVPQPSEANRERLIQWIEQGLGDESLASADPNLIKARRLSRLEYRNTIRDLLGVTYQPGADFPADDVNWSRHQETPVLPAPLLAKYQAAAALILQDADEANDLASPESGDDEPDAGATLASNSFSPMEAHCFGAESKAGAARQVLEGFGRRAFRRPATTKEMAEFVEVFDRADRAGANFDECLKSALQAMLASPHFLYRIEAPVESADVGERREYALASRLSYFLWKSMPDDELFAQAEQDLLRQNLVEQAQRFVTDSKASAFIRDFANAWLGVGKLKDMPIGDVALRRALRQETERLLAYIIQDDRSVLELLDCDYTFLNERLAQHYGVAGVEGKNWRRVQLAGTRRGGLVTQAGILTLTASLEHTSPVQRGKWIMENLLGTPPPAPPSGLLEAFRENRAALPSGTMRQALEQHRANSSCAHCHVTMDALGMALENFDARGLWRIEAGRHRIDATGDLANGETLEGPERLKAYLLERKDMFVRCLAGKLLSYALGRKLDEHDQIALDQSVHQVSQNGYRFSSVLAAVVSSESFQN